MHRSLINFIYLIIITGKTCEINTDECASNPCAHGGQCVDQVDGFECFCQLPYIGPTCLTKLDPCANNECRYGAKCIPDKNFTNYTCRCVVGFVGEHSTSFSIVQQVKNLMTAAEKLGHKIGLTLISRTILQ